METGIPIPATKVTSRPGQTEYVGTYLSRPNQQKLFGRGCTFEGSLVSDNAAAGISKSSRACVETLGCSQVLLLCKTEHLAEVLAELPLYEAMGTMSV